MNKKIWDLWLLSFGTSRLTYNKIKEDASNSGIRACLDRTKMFKTLWTPSMDCHWTLGSSGDIGTLISNDQDRELSLNIWTQYHIYLLPLKNIGSTKPVMNTDKITSWKYIQAYDNDNQVFWGLTDTYPKPKK